MKYIMKSKFVQVIESKFKKLLGYIGLVIIILMIISMIRNIGRVISIRKEVEKERLKLTKIEAENKRIQDEVAHIQTPEFVERQIRDKLGLVRDGETIVVLPDEEVLRKLAPKIDIQEDYLPDPIWKKWLKLFF